MNAEDGCRQTGSQTLTRGLDILGVVAAGPARLDDLVDKLSLSKPTTQRLVKALVDRGFLSVTKRQYHLGRAVLELGSRARAQVDVARIARPHVAGLAKATDAAIHLARIDGDRAICIDWIDSGQRSKPRIRIGDSYPVEGSAVEQALSRPAGSDIVGRSEGDRDEIWSIATPIRDADDQVIAVIIASRLSRDRLGKSSTVVAKDLQRAADAISVECGRWARQHRRRTDAASPYGSTDTRVEASGRQCDKF